MHTLSKIFVSNTFSFFQFLWLVAYSGLIMEIYVPNCPRDTNETSVHAEKDNASGEMKAKTLKAFLSFGFVHREDSGK